MTSPLRKRTAWLAAALLTVCWALLYLPHLRTCPGWYGDETLIHHTSRNLAAGQATNMALWNTFWHPHYPYQPAYSLLNGVFARAAGGDLAGSRFFNALLALAVALSLGLLGRRSFGIAPSVFAAAMFLTCEQSIIHYRMSYAHNAAGLGLLVMTLYLLRPSRPGNDWRAGAGLAIAAGSHPLFVHGALTAVLCRLRRPGSWVRLLLPPAVTVLLSLGAAHAFFGSWLWEDLLHLKNTFTTRGAADGGGGRSLANYVTFVSQDWYHTGMFCGLLLCIPLRRYAAPVIGLLVLFLLVRNRQNLVAFYYQAVVILPVLCLGWAGMMRYAFTRARRMGRAWRCVPVAVFCLPLVLFAGALPKSLGGSFTPRNQYWVTQSPAEVEAAAAWLNARLSPGDVVAGNPNIAWLLKAETVPYLQMITWYGLPTQGYESGNKRERFRFDASLENCRYAIIGDIDQRWTFGEPNVGSIAERLVEERWPVVWKGPNYLILANPRHRKPNP